MNPRNLLILLLSLLTTSPVFSQSFVNRDCYLKTTISVVSGETFISNCSGDGLPDYYRFDISSKAMPFVYVVTTPEDTILQVSLRRDIDFEYFGPGVYKVYAVSFLGGLNKSTGIHINDSRIGWFCQSISQNSITVYNIIPDGKNVTTESGQSTAFTCPDDGQSDFIGFATTSTDPFYTYVVTDESNTILGYANAENNFDFETVNADICRVWGLSYVGDLKQTTGTPLDVTDFTNFCYDLSDNFVTVTRSTPDGGSVALSDGQTEAILCGSDGAPDILTLDYQSPSPVPYAFVVTTTSGTVLQLLEGNTVDVEGIEEEMVHIYGVSYTGNLSITTGDMLDGVLSTDCYDVSDNAVVVNLSSAEGGQLTFSDGSPAKQICPGDAASNILIFAAANAYGDNYAFLITDTLDQLLFVAADNSFDFENAAEYSHLRVWGLAYSGTLQTNTGESIIGVNLSDLCFDLSDNYLSVEAQQAVGGTLALAQGGTETSICSGDELPDAIDILKNGTGGINYSYILTDTNNVLISTTLFDDQNLDLENAPVETVRIWGLSYFSAPELVEGTAASGLVEGNDCNALSENFISVQKIFVDGGEIMEAAGEAGTLICSNETSGGELQFTTNSTANLNYIFLLTGTDDALIRTLAGDSLALGSLPGGNYRVYGLSYSGELLLQTGDLLSEVAISDGCYELSANFHPVAIESVAGGQVSSASGENLIFVCAQDIYSDIINFSNTGSAEASYAYILADNAGEILEITANDQAEFNNLPSRIVRVWGLSYTGNLIAEVGDTLGTTALSDRCFDLSTNYIEVIREIPEGGSVAFAEGMTSFLSCPEASLSNVSMDSSGTTSGPYVYLVTDGDNMLLAIQNSGDQIDLDALPGTEFRIWGLAYTGTLLAEAGDDVLRDVLANDCFDLSDSYASVYRQLPSDSEVSSDLGQNISICPDGQANTIMLSNTQATPADYVYIVTRADEGQEGSIAALVTADTFDLNGLPEGNYSISGLAYSGMLQLELDSLLESELMKQVDVCYTASQNTLSVQVYVPESGDLFVNPPLTAENLNFCVGDGIGDTVTFNSANNSYGPNIKLVTDTNNVLIRLEPEAFIDFDTYETGTFRVWRMFYTGSLTVNPGDTITNSVLSSECYDLSNNFVEVKTTKIDGGSISSTALSEGNQIYLCDDGGTQVIELSNNSEASGANYVYVITNLSNLILNIFPENTKDLATIGFKDLKIYGLSYSGTLNAAPGRNILTTSLADGCYALSENILEVHIDDAVGGNLSANNGQTDILLCMTPGEGMLDFETTTFSDLGYAYILTSTSNTVLAVYDNPLIDFGDLPVGTYRVWGLSWSGKFTSDFVGLDASQLIWSDDCFELSDNFVAVDRRAAIDGGRLVPVNHDSEVYYVCRGSDNSPLVIWETETTDPNYQIVLTDGENVVIQPSIPGNLIDFSGAPAGTYRVWGISYSGNLNLTTRIDLDNLLSDACWQLSANYLTAYVDEAEGGNIFAAGSQNNQVAVIAGNGIADNVTFSNNSTSILKYTYLIIDQASDTLVAIIEGDSYDFDGTGQATLLVRGISYSGQLTIAIGDVISQSVLSDDCYEVSDNDIQVIKTDPNLRGEEMPTVNLIPRDIRDVAVAPNPATSWVSISFHTDLVLPTKGSLEIYQASGLPVRVIQIDLLPGLNQYTLPVSDLDRGMYLMKINAKGRIPETVKFAVQ